MLETKAGELAGTIWTALNENKEGLNQKALKKAAKIKADKDLFLALGWLLREGKIEVVETEDDMTFILK
ncbi:MAG: winged helix-turn-helix domain-containing protein [Bacteroidaceae bacterium]|nr:winged helix-turn-helix domain-containing protein [Bacteroidaceae bacterium]